LGQIRKKKR